MNNPKFAWNGQTSRRKFVTMATGVSAAAAMPFVFAGEASAARSPLLAQDLAQVGVVHPNRRDYWVIHHVGSSCTHTSTRTCQIYGCNCEYDFVIQWDGRLTVCASHTSATGSHARRCNCRALGVLLAGCFGCSNSCDPTVPSAAQECTLAALMAEVRYTSGRTSLYNVSNLRPHRNCYYWNPCGGTGTQTDCPGPTLVSNDTTYHNWSTAGLNFRAAVVAKYGHQERCGNCTGRPCA